MRGCGLFVQDLNSVLKGTTYQLTLKRNMITNYEFYDINSNTHVLLLFNNVLFFAPREKKRKDKRKEKKKKIFILLFFFSSLHRQRYLHPFPPFSSPFLHQLSEKFQREGG
uniref:Uncharacterized protein n=1 Tax=Cucumis melo TaxID=3656 RepID=A0A9I9ELT0_CUCME